MKKILLLFISLLLFNFIKAQNVGIGSSDPAAKLDVRGLIADPSIPDSLSTGIIRFGVTAEEGIDIGKMGFPTYAGWVQVGYAGETADPLSLQPMGGSVGIGTTNPSPSAALDISSTTQGFLPPRMTNAARYFISSPVAGLTIWCIDCGVFGELQVFNGYSWTNMTGGPKAVAIGEGYQGGIVAYILMPGDPGYVEGEVHGIVAAVNDQTSDAEWGCFGTNIPGAEGTQLGIGYQNTTDITNGCSEMGIAARICNDLVSGGFNDWYLPSKDELGKLYLNRIAIGGFANDYYWSSTEAGHQHAWDQYFPAGYLGNGNKSGTSHVRAVRSF